MNVLFIEDDPMNRRVVKDMLDVAGARHGGGRQRGEAACALIDAEDFDIVLVDLRMPGMDGFEAIRRIRGRGDDKAKLPIIVVTADTAVDLRERCLAAGADEVLFKPVAMDALFDAIGRHAGARRRRRRDDQLTIVEREKVEARPGIEPGCKDLQSSASPLRHRAGGGADARERGRVNRPGMRNLPATCLAEQGRRDRSRSRQQVYCMS